MTLEESLKLGNLIAKYLDAHLANQKAQQKTEVACLELNNFMRSLVTKTDIETQAL